MRKAIAVLALGATVGLLAAGCGGGKKSTTTATTGGGTTTTAASTPLTKAAYVKKMKALGKSLGTAITAAESATTVTALETALTTAQTDLRKTAGELKAMTPPAKARAGTKQLATAVNELADELGPVITQLKSGKLKTVTAALTAVGGLKGLADINTAANVISAAGFPITS